MKFTKFFHRFRYKNHFFVIKFDALLIIMNILVDFAYSVPDLRRLNKGNIRHVLGDIILLMIFAECPSVSHAWKLLSSEKRKDLVFKRHKTLTYKEVNFPGSQLIWVGLYVPICFLNERATALGGEIYFMVSFWRNCLRCRRSMRRRSARGRGRAGFSKMKAAVCCTVGSWSDSILPSMRAR